MKNQMNLNLFSAIVLISVLSLLTFTNCSFKKTPSDHAGLLQIILQETSTDLRLSRSLFQKNSSTGVPTSTADFDCFVLNITGPGIVKNDFYDGCSSTDNMRGRGFGLSPDFITPGETLEVTIPSGKDRSIDVYGVYPTPHECGGSGGDESSGGGGFFLGGVNREFFEDATVTIPISFSSGSKATLQCEGIGSDVSERTFIPDGTAENGKIFQYINGANCTVVDTAITTTNAPGSVATNYSEITNYSGPGFIDGLLNVVECLDATNSALMEVSWDLTQINYLDYSSFTVSWTGKVGKKTLFCSGVATTDADGGDLPNQLVEVYDGSNWTQVGGSTAGQAQSTISGTFNNPSDYLDFSGKIWVRVRGGMTSAGTQCSVIGTDQLVLTLHP